MKMLTEQWFLWALLSAVFAALTAIFAKVGMEKIDSDYGTLLRTFVLVPCLAVFVSVTGKWQNPFGLVGKTLLFLALSGLATGASWVCYFRALKLGKASEVAPVDKLSVVLVAIFAVTFLKERLYWQEWVGIGLVALGVVVLGINWEPSP
jgi:bacterial/archaeal transporter family protein